jgi:hypothetical protein
MELLAPIKVVEKSNLIKRASNLIKLLTLSTSTRWGLHLSHLFWLMGEKDVSKRKSIITKEKEGEEIDGSGESTNR